MSKIELWGGVECTINRVHGIYHNQIIQSGHWQRPRDLELFAQLGFKTLRYPFLWEMAAPDGNLNNADWSWFDERLRLLNSLNIRPIAGLLHHGSGPSHTDLCDPDFSQKFLEYATAFALRYPWVEDYTPINEPLTTARFSTLYGFWYPHAQDEASFAKAIFNQCKAIVLSMKAIRCINPQARLIQTEDLGTIFSTPPLRYQAFYENERRWLSLDLICGRVNPQHYLWKKMLIGVSEKDLNFFLENPCPPDIIGINYYLSSDRFLDHKIDQYPTQPAGGNGIDRYVDVMAVHSKETNINGHFQGLMTAWERYGLPLAITEVHLDSSREEQMRWLKEAWEAANQLKEQKVDMRAVTVWSLLGCLDWNSLVTKPTGYYETGAYDIRSGSPRSTAIASMIKSLIKDGTYHHPVLKSPGWWRRPCRVLNRKARFEHIKNNKEYASHSSQPVLISGANGTLGQAFGKICEYRALSYRLLNRHQMDIAHYQSVLNAIDSLKPWAVINAAGYVRVDTAELESEKCFRENTTGAEMIAQACHDRDIPLLTFSTDLVFDGSKNGHFEHDDVAPQNTYGKSKAEAEKKVMAICPNSLIIRTSSFFSPWDEHNFLTLALRSWQEGKVFPVKNDSIVTPTYVPDLVHTCLDLLIDQEKGIWHITNGEALSWSEFAHRLASMTKVPISYIDTPISQSSKNLALLSRKGNLLPSLQNGLEKYLEDMECIPMDEFIKQISSLEESTHYDESHSKQ